jgi:lipopolysaccharide export system permease protein
MAGKGGKAIGFGMSLGVILIYYMLLVISINLGEKGIMPSAIILWLPDFVITCIGLMLFKKMSRK